MPSHHLCSVWSLCMPLQQWQGLCRPVCVGQGPLGTFAHAPARTKVAGMGGEHVPSHPSFASAMWPTMWQAAPALHTLTQHMATMRWANSNEPRAMQLLTQAWGWRAAARCARHAPPFAVPMHQHGDTHMTSECSGTPGGPLHAPHMGANLGGRPQMGGSRQAHPTMPTGAVGPPKHSCSTPQACMRAH